MALQEITGAITEKTIKEGVSGSGKPWTMVTFTISNKQYNSFDAKIRTDHKIGDNVKMTGETEGKYWSMKSMVKIDDVFTASERVETPQAERVVTQALRTSRHFAELNTKDVLDTARHIYLSEQNVDGLKFSDIVDMVTEEFIKTSKKLEKELSS